MEPSALHGEGFLTCDTRRSWHALRCEPSTPAISREKLIAAVEAFLGNSDAETREGLRADIVRVMDEAGPDALVAFNERFADAGTDWNYYPRDPLAREIHRQLAHRFLGDGSRCDGVHQVEAVAGRPVVIFANHLSYSDANLFEVLVSRAGGGGAVRPLDGPGRTQGLFEHAAEVLQPLLRHDQSRAEQRAVERRRHHERERRGARREAIDRCGARAPGAR